MSNLPDDYPQAVALDHAASSLPDLVWRTTISGLLKELTAEVLALTEVVMTMNEKLAAMEASNQDSGRSS